MDPNSWTAVKKHVGGTGSKPAKLHLVDHDGTMWATNKFWVAPASRVAPLLERFNLDPGKPGDFTVNGTVRQDATFANPALGRHLGRHLDPALYTVPMVPVHVAGRQAHVRSASGVMMAAYQAADDYAFLGLDNDDLEWLTSVYTLETPDDCYYGPTRLLTTAQDGDRNRAVAIVADLIRRVTPVEYAKGSGERTGGETENLGPRVIGIIASVKLGES